MTLGEKTQVSSRVSLIDLANIYLYLKGRGIHPRSISHLITLSTEVLSSSIVTLRKIDPVKTPLDAINLLSSISQRNAAIEKEELKLETLYSDDIQGEKDVDKEVLNALRKKGGE